MIRTVLSAALACLIFSQFTPARAGDGKYAAPAKQKCCVRECKPPREKGQHFRKLCAPCPEGVLVSSVPAVPIASAVLANPVGAAPVTYRPTSFTLAPMAGPLAGPRSSDPLRGISSSDLKTLRMLLDLAERDKAIPAQKYDKYSSQKGAPEHTSNNEPIPVVDLELVQANEKIAELEKQLDEMKKRLAEELKKLDGQDEEQPDEE